MNGESTSPAEVITEALAAHLGPSTARTAVRTFSTRALGVPPGEVSASDAPRLLEALRPMLRTLLGAGTADELVAGIRRHLR